MRYRRGNTCEGAANGRTAVLGTPRMGRFLFLAAATVAVSVVFSGPSQALAGGSESRIKAEFTSRFAEFASWPSGAITEDASAFHLCVAGDGDMAKTLKAISKRLRVHDRKVRVRRIRLPSSAEGCHLVYLPSGSKSTLRSTLRLIGNKPILTVSDSSGFGREGVMINMYRKGKTVGFEINRAALDAAGIRMPAKVLRLGRELK